MTFLYVSCLASNKIQARSVALSSAAVQKFHSAIVGGLVSNAYKVTVLSSTTSDDCTCQHVENNVEYKYLTKHKFGYKRYSSLLFRSFLETYKFMRKSKDAIVICDVLNVMISLGAMIAARLMKRKVVGIVTDLPGLMVGASESKLGLPTMLSKWMITKFTHYVLLTEAMNDIVNPNSRPHLVMEGIADTTAIDTSVLVTERRNVIIYAGGMYKRYGVKKLIDAFVQLGRMDFELHLYGSGDMVEYARSLESYGVKYFGVQPNSVVLEDEKDAWLLVNPRPTDEEFTKYSFPSKNIEYMLSGTPILTTRLPGMPEEYYPYVYILEDESSDGFASKLSEIMDYPIAEINVKGKEAQAFISISKNAKNQARRIISLCQKDF